jgi:hypothetical protein
MNRSVSFSIVAAVLLAGPAVHAQSLQWVQAPSNGIVRAVSIAVAPNDQPFIATDDAGAYYLGQVRTSCGTMFCFPQLGWLPIPGVRAAQVAVNLDGVPFVVDTQGQTYVAITSQTAADTTSQITGWVNFRDQAGTCVHQFVPGVSTGFTEGNYTPPATQFIPQVWGLSCGTVDGSGDHPLMEWNVELTNFSIPWWSYSPGWTPIGPGSSAAQMTLFTQGGPSNIQIPWIRTASGDLYSYNGYQFVRMPSPRVLVTRRPIPVPTWITDHYAIDAGSIYAWSDSSQSWSPYASAMTPAGTEIVQISSSQPITTNGYGVVGPSRIWGIDQNGAVWALSKQGVAL